MTACNGFCVFCNCVIVAYDCGCEERLEPDGTITDSGCRFHMPHASNEKGPEVRP